MNERASAIHCEIDNPVASNHFRLEGCASSRLQAMKRPLTDNEKAALRELKEHLARDFGLVEMRLFGSRARGEGDVESDLDVLAVLERTDWETEKRIYDIAFDLDLKHDVVLSMIIYSRTDFDSPLNKACGFYREVQRDGVLL